MINVSDYAEISNVFYFHKIYYLKYLSICRDLSIRQKALDRVSHPILKKSSLIAIQRP